MHMGMAPAELSTLPRIHKRILTEIGHSMEKNHGRVGRKAFVLKQKAQLCARVDFISSCGGRKADKVLVCFEKKKKPKTSNKSTNRQKHTKSQTTITAKPTQSAFSKLRDTC